MNISGQEKASNAVFLAKLDNKFEDLIDDFKLNSSKENSGVFEVPK